MRKFAIAHHRAFFNLAFACALAVFVLPLAGCGVPTWLSDAGSIVALVSASFTSIASFIAGLTGNTALAAALATVSTWVTKVQTGLSDLTSLISQYQSSASTGLLAEIEAALTDVQNEISQDFSNLGLPSTVLNVIAGIAGLAANLLSEWSAAISGVKSATTSAEYKAATAHIATLADNLPASMKSFRSSVNAILNTKTGDSTIDAALAAATRI